MRKSIRRYQRALTILLGSILLLCGAGFTLYYGRHQTLTCVRVGPAQIACTQQVSWFKWLSLDAAQTIEPVQAAATEEHCHTNSEASSYECQNNGVKLITPAAEVSLSSEFYNTETAQVAVDRLNQFIQSVDEDTLVLDNNNGFMTVLGLGCVALTFLLLGLLVSIYWR